MKMLFTDHIITMISFFINKKSFLFISVSLTSTISLIRNVLQIEFLGFSIGILVFLTLLVLFDFVTGIFAAIANKERITAKKGSKSVNKLILYFMFICFTALLQSLLVDKNYTGFVWIISNFKILIFCSISLWEFHSIGENLEKRYGVKPRMFKILDKFTELLERKLIEKIENKMDQF